MRLTLSIRYGTKYVQMGSAAISDQVLELKLILGSLIRRVLILYANLQMGIMQSNTESARVLGVKKFIPLPISGVKAFRGRINPSMLSF